MGWYNERRSTMPTKKAVVKSEAVAAGSPLAAEKAPAKVVRKRSTASTSKTSATESKAPASGEKKAATRKKSAVAEAAVTHRHAKKQESTSLELSVAVVAPVATTPYEPSHDEVAKLAYSYYVARGYQPGDQQADWFRAVEELKARHAAAASLLEK